MRLQWAVGAGSGQGLCSWKEQGDISSQLDKHQELCVAAPLL